MTMTTGTPARPYWQHAPCPAWCENTDAHGREWMYGDRTHWSTEYPVLLTTMNAVSAGDDGHLPVEARTFLTQHYREAVPRISLMHGDGASESAYMTLDEAEQIARHLLELVRQGRADQ